MGSPPSGENSRYFIDGHYLVSGQNACPTRSQSLLASRRRISFLALSLVLSLSVVVGLDTFVLGAVRENDVTGPRGSEGNFAFLQEINSNAPNNMPTVWMIVDGAMATAVAKQWTARHGCGRQATLGVTTTAA